MPVPLSDAIAGCLLGGAVGDALGAPVEFGSWATISAAYGPGGIRDLPGDGRFTDDTQMTLFTCEGLIRSARRWRRGEPAEVAGSVHHSYLCWLHTQGVPWEQIASASGLGSAQPDGWLVHEPRLHRREAPGATCLSALRSGRMGVPGIAVNDSKGCGGVMRAAPAGLFWPHDPRRAYEAGCEVAAITHGHPDGWASAGALAAIIAVLAAGGTLAQAVEQAQSLTTSYMAEVLAVATELAAGGMPSPDDIESALGGGWVGEEALAIAVCCAAAAAGPEGAAGPKGAAGSEGAAGPEGARAGCGPRAAPPPAPAPGRPRKPPASRCRSST